MATTLQQRISKVDLDRIITGTMRLDASSSPLGKLLGRTPEDEPGEFIVLVPNDSPVHEAAIGSVSGLSRHYSSQANTQRFPPWTLLFYNTTYTVYMYINVYYTRAIERMSGMP